MYLLKEMNVLAWLVVTVLGKPPFTRLARRLPETLSVKVLLVVDQHTGKGILSTNASKLFCILLRLKYCFFSPVLSIGSKNGTLPRNKSAANNQAAVSPTPSSTDSQLDILFKSLAKESLSGITRDDKRNEINKLDGKCFFSHQECFH